MSFFSDIAPWAGGIIGGLVGGPTGAAVGFGIGSSVAGSQNQSDAASSAANAQVSAGDRATLAQLEMYDKSRADVLQFRAEDKGMAAPWRVAGERDLGKLGETQQLYADAINDPSKYEQSPGYGWLQQQGIDTLNKGASASGSLDSGERSKDLMAYGQGLAKQDYSGYLGRLESLMSRYNQSSQTGLSAVQGIPNPGNTLANINQNTAGSLSNIYQQQGDAVASGEINRSNAQTGLYNNLSQIGSNAVNQYTLNSYLQKAGRN